MAESSASACSGLRVLCAQLCTVVTPALSASAMPSLHADIGVLAASCAARGGWRPGTTLSSPISERTKGRSMLIQRCQWVSTKPGMQIRPRPSITSAPDTLTFSPTAAMAPSRMWTAPLAKSPSRSSMVSTLAPRITISPRAGSGSARPDWAARPAGRQPMAPNAAAPSSTVRRVKRWMVIGLVLPRKR